MTPRPLYQVLAQTLQAYRSCVADPSKADWADKHKAQIDNLVDCLPSGSGIDCGTKFDTDASSPERLVFHVSFHHMTEDGYYDGWTEHTITVTPSLVSGLNLRIGGQNRNDIKDYLHDVYSTELVESVVWHVPSTSYVLERWVNLKK